MFFLRGSRFYLIRTTIIDTSSKCVIHFMNFVRVGLWMRCEDFRLLGRSLYVFCKEGVSDLLVNPTQVAPVSSTFLLTLMYNQKRHLSTESILTCRSLCPVVPSHSLNFFVNFPLRQTLKRSTSQDYFYMISKSVKI